MILTRPKQQQAGYFNTIKVQLIKFSLIVRPLKVSFSFYNPQTH